MPGPTRPFAAVLVFAATLAPGALGAQRWTLPDSVRHTVDSVFAFVGRDEPGCALGVIQDGRLAYGRGYGLANMDWQVPITTSTVFDIGSVSKQFTATAIALLDMDGVLSIDDDVHRWIPELADYGAPLTIRHLLNHTSGVRDYLTLLRLKGFDYDNVFDEEDGVELIVRQQALNFPPGSEYLYSNSGYLLLANIVRRATGMSLRAVLEARVFDPLGMAHTSIWDRNTEILAERATGYAPGRDGWGIDHAWNFQMGGDGQVITSVEDLQKWDANFYEPRVGGPGLLERIQTRGVLTSGDTIPYAMGLVLDRYRGLARVQHGGSWAGFRAQLTRFPEQRTSVVVECNRGDASPSRYADRVADAVLAGAFSEPPVAAAPEPETTPAVSLTEAELRRWAGTYRHTARPTYVALEVRDGALRVGGGGGALTPLDAVTFRTGGGGEVRFAERNGVATATVQNDTYTRVSTARGGADAASAAGTYHSEELDASWTLEPDAEGLSVTLPGGERVVLRAGAPDEFFGQVTVTLVRAGGRVSGLRVYAGRVTGIVFERVGS